MLTTTTEYTPGQMIRFEAVALCNNATRLRETMLEARPELDFLEVPAMAGMSSVRRNPGGEPAGINRKQEHYEVLMRVIRKARRQIERRPVSENSRRAWRLLNRCHYHCASILAMMERHAPARGTWQSG